MVAKFIREEQRGPERIEKKGMSTAIQAILALCVMIGVLALVGRVWLSRGSNAEIAVELRNPQGNICVVTEHHGRKTYELPNGTTGVMTAPMGAVALVTLTSGGYSGEEVIVPANLIHPKQ